MGNEENFDIKQKVRVKLTLLAHPLETGACLWAGEKCFGPVQPLEDGQKWATSAEVSDMLHVGSCPSCTHVTWAAHLG